MVRSSAAMPLLQPGPAVRITYRSVGLCVLLTEVPPEWELGVEGLAGSGASASL